MLSGVIKEFTNFVSSKRIRTSSFAFKIITRFTVNILITFVFVISLQQYFGEPIYCDTKTHKDAIRLKCWTEGSYLYRACLNGTIGKDVVSYGIGGDGSKCQRASTVNGDPEAGIIRQRHYQWVIPILTIQAILLFFPRVIWHNFEGGLMEKLLENTDSPVVNDNWTSKKKYILKFMREFSKRSHHCYFLKYVFCEILAALTLMLNALLMHWGLNDFWTEFEPAISALLRRDTHGFFMNSAKIFPSQAKCEFFVFGGSGSVEKWDALCFLPQNVINEKIFVFLYFWYIMLAFTAAINLARIFFMFSLKFLRIGDLRRMSEHYYGRRQRSFFNFYSDYGYWFVLCLLHKNLSPVLFKDLIHDMMKSGEDDISKLFREDPEMSMKQRDIGFVDERSSDDYEDTPYKK